MGKIESATQWIINIANDDSHGYDQTNRWGPDYDCSSLVISAWQNNGVPVKSNGASYTGDMQNAFVKCGFSNIISKINLDSGSGLKRGDVLLNRANHTAMYIGSNQIVAARINEKGTKTGGKIGDQTGKEICIQNYYNFPWDCILRYTSEDTGTGTTPTPGNANIRQGQTYANSFAKTGITVSGTRDAATKKAGIKVLQTALNKDYGSGLEVDGIWGTATSNALGNHYVASGETQYMVTAAEILVLLRGYSPNGVEVPGTFGSGLMASIKSFQKAQGLTVSGTCDRATFLKLIN